MIKVILIFVAIVLSMFGLSELLHKIWMSFIRPGKVKNTLVITLRDGSAAEQVAAVVEEMHWFGKNYADLLIGVDMGIDAVVAEKCRMIQQNNSDFIFCTPDEISRVISQRS